MIRRRVEPIDVVFVDVELNEWARSVFGVGVACEIGYAHTHCTAPDGTQHAIPAGVAHLLEHTLTSAYLQANRSWVASSFLVAQTTADRTVWAVPALSREPADSPDEISDVVSQLVSIPRGEIADDEFEMLLGSETDVIAGEARYRAERSYRLQTALTEALYPGDRLGRDPLSQEDNLPNVQLAEVLPVRETVRDSMRSVTVIACEIGPEVADRVCAELAPVFETGRASWEASGDPPPALVENRLVVVEDEAAKTSESAEVLLGIRVASLRDSVPDSAARARQLILHELLALSQPSPIAYRASRDSRHFAGSRHFAVPWPDAEAFPYAVDDYRRELMRRLPQTKDHLTVVVDIGLSNLLDNAPGAVLRLAHRADLHDLRLEDALSAAAHIGLDDVDRLRETIARGSRAAAYWGPELG